MRPTTLTEGEELMKSSKLDDFDQNRPEVVQSLIRGLKIIRIFDAENSRLTLSEAAALAGVPRAAVRRFFQTFVSIGYMRTDGRYFSLAPRILELGHSYLTSLSLPQISLPHLEELAERTQNSIALAVLDSTEVVYVARISARRITDMGFQLGSRFPAHLTAVGRAILSGLEDTRLDRFLADADLAPRTRFTVTSADMLADKIKSVRTSGYAFIDEELEMGLRSIAIPIKDFNGRVVAAVNVSSRSSLSPFSELVPELLPPLLECGKKINEDLRILRPSLPIASDYIDVG